MKRRFLLHAAYWLVFWLVYAYTYSRYDGNLPKYLLTEAIQMPARMLATYGSIFCFRYFSSPKTAWPAFVGAAVFSVLGGWMNRLIKLFWLVPAYFPDSTIAFWDSRMMYDIFDCVLAASIALSVQMYFRQQDLLRSREMLRAEKYEAELQALKSQIHPHFLFNTINNLYALARVKSDQTAPVALQLAQLLRYLLYESAKPSVPLRQEIKLLEDYIALEKLRYDEDRLQVNYTCDVDNPEQPISPLLLLPLVENAFKHGASEQYYDAHIDVTLVLRNGLLRLEVQNPLPTNYTPEPGGIGLKNLRRQLELLYPGQYQLDFQKSATNYTATLTLQLPAP